MIFLILLALAVLFMAYRDPHPITSGKSLTLWAKASYIKVQVHFVCGIALAALADPFFAQDFWLLIYVLVLGGLYELIQWYNLKGEKRGGVFTVAEAVAVALGALVLIVVKYLPVWF
jgi:hypothetical protein